MVWSLAQQDEDSVYELLPKQNAEKNLIEYLKCQNWPDPPAANEKNIKVV